MLLVVVGSGFIILRMHPSKAVNFVETVKDAKIHSKKNWFKKFSFKRVSKSLGELLCGVGKPQFLGPNQKP